MGIITDGSKIDKIVVDDVLITTDGIDKKQLISAMKGCSGLSLSENDTNDQILSKIQSYYGTYLIYYFYQNTNDIHGNMTITIYSGTTNSQNNSAGYKDRITYGSAKLGDNVFSHFYLGYGVRTNYYWSFDTKIAGYVCDNLGVGTYYSPQQNVRSWYAYNIKTFYFIPIITK